jgi:hypothetical protein
MPRNCCGGSQRPALTEGRQIGVGGSGSSQDPYVISATTDLDVEDNLVFLMTLAGTGTLESPWRLQVHYAPTARLTDIPNVDTGDLQGGYTLLWDDVNEVWTTGPAATAAPGLISSGNGITGDGSGGSPLAAVGNAARYIAVTSAGLNALVRPFATEAARAAASPAAVTGTLSILATNPDRIDRFDGSDWQPITGGVGLDAEAGSQLLALSGGYADGPVTVYSRPFTDTTDSTGALEVIPAADLGTYSGVLDATVQETGAVVWHCQVLAGANNVTAVAYSVATGAPLVGATVSGTVNALLY